MTAPPPADVLPAVTVPEENGPGAKHTLSPRQRRALAEASASSGGSASRRPAEMPVAPSTRLPHGPHRATGTRLPRW